METNMMLTQNQNAMTLINCSPKFISMDLKRSTSGGLLADDILKDDTTGGQLDGLANVNVGCDSSTLDSRRRRTCRLARIQVASFISNSNSNSNRFDDSPTRGIFAIEEYAMSMSSWGNKIQQWFDYVDLAYSTFPDLSYPPSPCPECDSTSMSTFGPSSEEIPSLVSESQDDRTIFSTIDDPQCSSSSDEHHLDFLDEQLLNSPMDSFTAMCWDSTVAPDQPTRKRDYQVAKLRHPKLYCDVAEQYEEAHLRESSQLASVVLPETNFTKSRSRARRTSPEEVVPWSYIPKKAATVLDLPQDLSAALAIQQSVTSSRVAHQRRYPKKASLGSMTKSSFNFNITGRKK